MYKNIIKLTAIAAKDTPAAILKKIKKHDPGFVKDRDLELESYLSRRSSLSFYDFSVLLEDCYARYAIEEEFINRFIDAPDQRHVKKSNSLSRNCASVSCARMRLSRETVGASY